MHRILPPHQLLSRKSIICEPAGGSKGTFITSTKDNADSKETVKRYTCCLRGLSTLMPPGHGSHPFKELLSSCKSVSVYSPLSFPLTIPTTSSVPEQLYILS